jgi:soluble lytic murein transglycosylase-like protein
MPTTLRLLAAGLVAMMPSAIVGLVSPAFGTATSAPLRATLRPAAGPRAPAWLAQAVCERGAELGEACGLVAVAVAEEARLARLDPVLVLAVIEVESGWDPGAVSSRDARGLMQLRTPAIEGEAAGGRLASADPHDPMVNVRAGIRYLGRLLHRFQDAELALVAYNAGPNRLATYLRAEEGVPERFWEYPRRVRQEERRLRAQLAAPATLLAAADRARVGE